MSKIFGALMEPFHRVVGSWYRKQVQKELVKYGLRYDDLLDPKMNLDVKEALNRLPQREVDLRNQRIKRAIDISQKHTELPDELKKLQTPFNFYLKPVVEKIEAENAERAELGTGKPYDRQIP
ncbi:ubiquinol-cytochrome C reductase complex protein [Chloropicon roscoffensis]